MARITFAEPFSEALKICRPYVVAPRSHWDDLDLAPLGAEVQRRLIETRSGLHAPFREESAAFDEKE